ncbi:protein kinase domain-containing protein [Haliangium sp.]|uniref:serine/threonine protein kinase n=1 Tax=Haliangium sp. TaxID=2663208 RepID=UPI003D12B9D4
MELPSPHSQSGQYVDPLIGATIGNYEVKSKLGVGGMGSVYLAEHPLIGKKVALKVLHAAFSTDPTVVDRFFNEARAVNDVQHPNIVDIVDYGVIPGAAGTTGTVYFIMEFLDGPTLSQVLAHESPLPPERALAIGLQIADALAASHGTGIIHRDLKPENIILIQRGRQADFVKVLDFGIAKLTGGPEGASRTRTGMVIGTPAYMSPEQCDGGARLDHRSDIYSLGILLYEMLTGRAPFGGEGYQAILMQQLTQAPTPLSTLRGVIPPHVEAIVLKTLEKRPEARFQSMEELMHALADPVGYVDANGGLTGFLGTTPLSMYYQGPDRQVSLGMSVVAPGMAVGPSLHGAGTLPVHLLPAGAAPGRRRVLFIAMIAAVVLGAVGGGLWFVGWDGLTEDAAATAPGSTDDPGRDDRLASAGAPTPAEPQVADPAIILVDDAPPEPSGQAGAVAEVSVSIDSRPPGAEVFLADSDQSMGQTPLEFDVPKGDEEVEVILRLDGYKDTSRRFSPDSNKVFELKLRRDRRSSRDRRSRSERSGRSSRDSRADDRDRQADRSSGRQGDKSGDKTADKTADKSGDKTEKIRRIEDDVGLEDPTY